MRASLAVVILATMGCAARPGPGPSHRAQPQQATASAASAGAPANAHIAAGSAPAPETRPRASVVVLPALTAEEQDAIDAGILRLFNDTPAVRVRAAVKFADMGPRARIALKYLVNCMMHDENVNVARACSNASAAIGPGASTVLEIAATGSSPRAPLARRALRTIDRRVAAMRR